MKDATATMGSILPDDVGGKDAVHVAVVAAIAGTMLAPGQNVGLDPDATPHTAVPSKDNIGIVDPYLKGIVAAGQRFWLFLYPRTITGLNHVWTHPAFPDDEAPTGYNTPAQRSASEQWLRRFAANSDIPGYGAMMDAVARSDGSRVHFGDDATGTIPPEFWDHVEIVTGRTFPRENRAEYFTCSC